MDRIDDRSPLYNLDAAALAASPLEIIVWVTGHAEGASEIFQARSVQLVIVSKLYFCGDAIYCLIFFILITRLFFNSA